MTENVVKLSVVQGDGFHIEADAVLEASKGQLVQLVLVGIDLDGELFMAGTDGSAESVFLMERAKARFVEFDCVRCEA